MQDLRNQEPKLILPSVRSALLKIHEDLFTIDSYVKKSTAYYPESLTEFEKLTLVLEDRRFLNHSGVDLLSILRESLRAITFRKHGGASTIDMQFVRTATNYRQQTLRRKFYEIFLAVMIQFRYKKIVILRSYLACAFFGSHLIGANVAAHKLFGCTADNLSTNQAARIAAMLVYPRPLSEGDKWKSKVQRRADYGIRVYLTNKKSFEKLPR